MLCSRFPGRHPTRLPCPNSPWRRSCKQSTSKPNRPLVCRHNTSIYIYMCVCVYIHIHVENKNAHVQKNSIKQFSADGSLTVYGITIHNILYTVRVRWYIILWHTSTVDNIQCAFKDLGASYYTLLISHIMSYSFGVDNKIPRI